MGGLRSKDLALATMVAAIYALLVYFLPSLSFLVFQVRIADALVPSSAILGWPAVIGVALGCFIANALSPWGSPFLIGVDMVLGSVANLLASYMAMKMSDVRRLSPPIRFQASCLIANLIVSMIVGTYLPFLMEIAFNVPMPLWAGWTGVFMGGLISMNLAGYLLLMALWRRGLRGS